MIREIRAVVFDYGRVLCLPPDPEEFQKLATASGIDAEVFAEGFWRYRDDYDRGKLDGPGYWRRVCGTNGNNLTSGQIAALISSDIQLWLRLNTPMVEWAHALARNGVKTAVLSNMPHDLADYLRKTATWLKPFSGLYYSAEMGCAKPEPRAFEMCLQGIGTKPDATMFIDDHAANVEAARAFGLHALRYESVSQLAADLKPFRLPASLADVDGRKQAEHQATD